MGIVILSNQLIQFLLAGKRMISSCRWLASFRTLSKNVVMTRDARPTNGSLQYYNGDLRELLCRL